ncbi:hypothetical protein DL96DRAFT_1676062 [Flagelloscypha sp. PMI_526]|nr:hypothetical protein DL96DRAFT_1676062 [Flagelloscypha sp. PMI_526]
MSKRSATAANIDGPSSKKTRFVDPADDPADFEEQVDANLEARGGRRKRVRNEGYDSDSSDDGEGVVDSRKKGGKDDDDEDMFADEDGGSKEPAAKKKATTFMRLGDIEGQEFGKVSGEGSDSDASDEPEDEDDAIRRSKAGMGFEMSSFNMREEMEEGKFTDDGSYVRTVDQHAIHDRWMDGVDEREMKQARRRKKQREKEQEAKIEAEKREIEESGGTPALQKELLAFLKKGETVLEALQRLGQKKRKAKDQAQAEIERVTHLAGALMSEDTDIYSRTYEELVRSVRASKSVPQDWDPPSADTKYEYRWAGETSSEVFGPFSEDEMKAWFKASYFGSSGEKVDVRQVGGPWLSWDDVLG